MDDDNKFDRGNTLSRDDKSAIRMRQHRRVEIYSIYTYMNNMEKLKKIKYKNMKKKKQTNKENGENFAFCAMARIGVPAYRERGVCVSVEE